MNTALSTGTRRTLFTSNALTKNVHFATIAVHPALKPKVQTWRCEDCTWRSPPKYETFGWSQKFSTLTRRFDSPPRSESPIPRTPFNPKPPESAAEPPTPSTAALPSKTDQQRWQISRRMANLMDSILARASVAGQHINVYTGTDYSGIEAIKSEINAQEDKVDNCHAAIDNARSTHHQAHAKQGSSQKEIVSLLERKSSWSPEDLERYMSLVRSEHSDEQAVQAAKDNLAATERDLQNARAELERLERKVYHEEQIWSDTIRRNSTWVTFGLMGLNIFLLLAQIAIFEPYRRRKIVKEVRQSLDEKAAAAVGVAPAVERQIDAVVEPQGVPIEVVVKAVVPEQSADSIVSSTAQIAQATQEVLVAEVPAFTADSAQATLPPSSKPQTWAESWESWIERLQDLFSERIIQVKKVDITTTALQGAATGVAAMGLLFVLWRPK